MFHQLDNPDEQAAQIRRELDGRLQMADQIARVRDEDGCNRTKNGLSSPIKAHCFKMLLFDMLLKKYYVLT